MKYIFLLFFFVQFSFAQRSNISEDIIIGSITVNGEPENTFKIFIFDTKKNPKNVILKYESKDQSNKFRFNLTNVEMENYKFMEIATTKGAKIIKLNSLLKDGYSKNNSKDEIYFDLIYHKIRPDTTRDKAVMIEKPAIYLYPEKETSVTVKHEFLGKMNTTYPEYNNGWEVVASPKGILYNKADQRNYSYLFWDGFYEFPASHYNYKDGFYVEKKYYTKFLHEKLKYIGLNETEINDFVVYWLPQMNLNEKVFVHFRINDNIDNVSFLKINPEPDTLIRVFMEFREVTKNEKPLPTQILPKFERKKFVVVEWGGSRMNTNKVE